MNAATVKLLSEFESLAGEGKQAFVLGVSRYLPRWDSGPLTDDVAAAAADQLAAMINEEECASSAG